MNKLSLSDWFFIAGILSLASGVYMTLGAGLCLVIVGILFLVIAVLPHLKGVKRDS